MPATSPRSKHTLTAEQVKKGGKNSKRGPSLRKRFEELMTMDIPPEILKALKENKIVAGSHLIANEIKPLAKNTGDAIARVTVAEAIKREPWAVKLITEQIDGAAKQKLEHTGAEGGPIESETSIKPDTLKEVEALLYKNQTPIKPA